MFNPLAPDEVLTAVGVAARDAARGDGLTSEYSRGQLMSAYSITRHLTVELDSYEPEICAYAREVAARIRAAAPGLAEDAAGDAAAVADELGGVRDARAAGELTSVLLDRLRHDPSQAARTLRAQIHGRLRVLSEREVELLAEVIEGPAQPAAAP